MIFHFPYFYQAYDGLRRIDFTCKCGSHCVTHIDESAVSFLEGSFMCLRCGMSVIDNKVLNYYHPLFRLSYHRYPVQLSLF